VINQINKTFNAFFDSMKINDGDMGVGIKELFILYIDFNAFDGQIAIVV
jgi:hypothetical protein